MIGVRSLRKWTFTLRRELFLRIRRGAAVGLLVEVELLFDLLCFLDVLCALVFGGVVLVLDVLLRELAVFYILECSAVDCEALGDRNANISQFLKDFRSVPQLVLNCQVIDLLWLVLFDVLDRLGEWERVRVEADEDITLVPVLNRLIEQHVVVELDDLDLRRLAEMSQYLFHWPRTKFLLYAHYSKSDAHNLGVA